MRVCGAPTTGFATTKEFSRAAQVFTLPVATWMQIASALGMKIEPLRRPVRLTRFADGIAYYEPGLEASADYVDPDVVVSQPTRPRKRRTLAPSRQRLPTATTSDTSPAPRVLRPVPELGRCSGANSHGRTPGIKLLVDLYFNLPRDERGGVNGLTG